MSLWTSYSPTEWKDIQISGCKLHSGFLTQKIWSLEVAKFNIGKCCMYSSSCCFFLWDFFGILLFFFLVCCFMFLFILFSASNAQQHKQYYKSWFCQFCFTDVSICEQKLFMVLKVPQHCCNLHTISHDVFILKSWNVCCSS